MQPRLAEFRIDDLFGLYDHRIPLRQDERVTIVIGPNGRGKTVCLKLILALFKKKFNFFTEIDFSTAEFLFSSGHRISVAKAESDSSPEPPIAIVLSQGGEILVEWQPGLLDPKMRRELRRSVPSYWQHMSGDTWVDERDGEEVTTADLVERYSLPDRFQAAIGTEMPSALSDLLDQIDCHLIETQRLLVLGSEDVGSDEYRRVRRRSSGSTLAIQDKAEKLSNIIKNTIGAYANLSQSLDRSFPLTQVGAWRGVGPAKGAHGLRDLFSALSGARFWP